MSKILRKALDNVSKRHKWTSWSAHFAWGGMVQGLGMLLLHVWNSGWVFSFYIVPFIAGGVILPFIWENIIGPMKTWEPNPMDWITFTLGALTVMLPILFINIF